MNKLLGKALLQDGESFERPACEECGKLCGCVISDVEYTTIMNGEEHVHGFLEADVSDCCGARIMYVDPWTSEERKAEYHIVENDELTNQIKAGVLDATKNNGEPQQSEETEEFETDFSVLLKMAAAVLLVLTILTAI